MSDEIKYKLEQRIIDGYPVWVKVYPPSGPKEYVEAYPQRPDYVTDADLMADAKLEN